MNAEEWGQVDKIFNEALDREPVERARFIEESCADDVSLRKEVEGLLGAHERAGRFLESGAAKAVSSLGGSIAPGTRFGPYEILAAIGAGGMGEVHRARDTKLGRDVAIKVLPSVFTSDPDRLARFEREARMLATLNHPHIGAIYGFEESAGLRGLVLELVEGETLAERIARGKSLAPPIPIGEALAIAQQIADALEAAHEKGIVHRDLKPANIKITPAGDVKVLDFGIAKIADSAESSAAPAMTRGKTGEGIILGTVPYMSPEQARGQTVDKRTDIWAFGCLLYEMSTGRPAFTGDTVSDTIARILEREPDWTALPESTPSAVRRLLQRCLDKDPKRRLHDIADARVEIEDILSGAARTLAPEFVPGRRDPASSGVSRKPRKFIPAVFILLSVGLIGGLIGFMLRPRPERALDLWTGTLLSGPNVALSPRVSPDGKKIAFLLEIDGLTQVAVMNPDSDPGNWQTVTKDRTRGFVSVASWSTDGTRIYYTRNDGVPRGIYSVPERGGEERLLLDQAVGPEALPDGSFLVGRLNEKHQTQIHRYWPSDGRLDALPGILPNSEVLALRVLPGGSRAVFVGRSVDQPASDSQMSLYVLDLATRMLTKIPADLTSYRIGVPKGFAITPDGREAIVEAASGDLIRLDAIPLDPPGPARALKTLQQRVRYFDIGADGSLYVDQFDRAVEVVRFSSTGADPQRSTTLGSMTVLPWSEVHLPDGGTLVTAVIGGKRRILLGRPGQEPVPFIDTQEETSSPAARLGNDRLIFLIGNANERRIAIASLADRRVLRRIQGVKGDAITSIAPSPDGKTIYFVDSGNVGSIPAEDGQPHAIHRGDGVAATPDGRSLIVFLKELDSVRLVRVSKDGSAEEPISIKGQPRLAPLPFGPDAVALDGRIALTIAVSDSYFWPPAILNPASGILQRIPVPYYADFYFPAWASDGTIRAAAYSLRSSLWRFRQKQ